MPRGRRCNITLLSGLLLAAVCGAILSGSLVAPALAAAPQAVCKGEDDQFRREHCDRCSYRVDGKDAICNWKDFTPGRCEKKPGYDNYADICRDGNTMVGCTVLPSQRGNASTVVLVLLALLIIRRRSAA